MAATFDPCVSKPLFQDSPILTRADRPHGGRVPTPRRCSARCVKRARFLSLAPDLFFVRATALTPGEIRGAGGLAEDVRGWGREGGPGWTTCRGRMDRRGVGGRMGESCAETP